VHQQMKRKKGGCYQTYQRRVGRGDGIRVGSLEFLQEKIDYGNKRGGYHRMKTGENQSKRKSTTYRERGRRGKGRPKEMGLSSGFQTRGEGG